MDAMSVAPRPWFALGLVARVQASACGQSKTCWKSCCANYRYQGVFKSRAARRLGRPLLVSELCSAKARLETELLDNNGSRITASPLGKDDFFQGNSEATSDSESFEDERLQFWDPRGKAAAQMAELRAKLRLQDQEVSKLHFQVSETEEALAVIQGATTQTQQVMMQLQDKLQDAIEADKAARALLSQRGPEESWQVSNLGRRLNGAPAAEVSWNYGEDVDLQEQLQWLSGIIEQALADKKELEDHLSQLQAVVQGGSEAGAAEAADIAAELELRAEVLQQALDEATLEYNEVIKQLGQFPSTSAGQANFFAQYAAVGPEDSLPAEDDQILELQQALKEANREKAEADSQVWRLHRDLDAAVADQQELQRELLRLRRDLDRAEQGKAVLERQIQQLQQESSAVSEDRLALEEELQRQVELLTLDIRETEQNAALEFSQMNAALQAVKADTAAAMEAKAAEVSCLKQQLKVEQSDAAQQKLRLTRALESARQDSSREVAALSTTLETLKQKSAANEANLQKILESTKADSKKEISRLTTVLNAVKSESATQISELKRRLEAVQSEDAEKMSMLAADLKVAQAEAASEAEQWKIALEATRAQARDDVSRLTAAIEASKAAAEKEVTALSAVLKETQEAAEKELARLSAALEASQAEASREIQLLQKALEAAQSDTGGEVRRLTSALQAAKDEAAVEIARFKQSMDSAQPVAGEPEAASPSLPKSRKTSAASRFAALEEEEEQQLQTPQPSALQQQKQQQANRLQQQQAPLVESESKNNVAGFLRRRLGLQQPTAAPGSGLDPAELVAQFEQMETAAALEVDRLTAALESLKKESAAEVSRLQVALSVSQKEAAAEIAKLKATMEASPEEAIAEVVLLATELEAVRANSLSEVAGLSMQLNQAYAELAQVHMLADSLAAEKNILEDQVISLAAILNNMEEDTAAEVARLTSALEVASADSQAEVKRLEAALAVAHTTAQDATTMFDCLEEDKQILGQQLKDKTELLERERQKSRAEQNSLQAQVAELQAKLGGGAARDQLQQPRAPSVADGMSEVQQLSAALGSFQGGMAAELSRLTGPLDASQADTQEVLQQLESQAAELGRQRAALRQQQEDLSKSDGADEVARLRSALEVAEVEKQQLALKLEQQAIELEREREITRQRQQVLRAQVAGLDGRVEAALKRVKMFEPPAPRPPQGQSSGLGQEARPEPTKQSAGSASGQADARKTEALQLQPASKADIVLWEPAQQLGALQPPPTSEEAAALKQTKLEVEPRGEELPAKLPDQPEGPQIASAGQLTAEQTVGGAPLPEASSEVEMQPGTAQTPGTAANAPTQAVRQQGAESLEGVDQLEQDASPADPADAQPVDSSTQERTASSGQSVGDAGDATAATKRDRKDKIKNWKSRMLDM